MDIDPGVFAALVVALLGAGGLGSFVAYRKAGPENVDLAAKTMAFVNDELRKANAELRAEYAERERELKGELAQCRERIAYLEARDREARGQDPIGPAT